MRPLQGASNPPKNTSFVPDRLTAHARWPKLRSPRYCTYSLLSHHCSAITAQPPFLRCLEPPPTPAHTQRAVSACFACLLVVPVLLLYRDKLNTRPSPAIRHPSSAAFTSSPLLSPLSISPASPSRTCSHRLFGICPRDICSHLSCTASGHLGNAAASPVLAAT